MLHSKEFYKKKSSSDLVDKFQSKKKNSIEDSAFPWCLYDLVNGELRAFVKFKHMI